jgi:hypothetical protein
VAARRVGKIRLKIEDFRLKIAGADSERVDFDVDSASPASTRDFQSKIFNRKSKIGTFAAEPFRARRDHSKDFIISDGYGLGDGHGGNARQSG